MLPRIISPIRILSPRMWFPILFIISVLLSGCSTAPSTNPAVTDIFTPTPQVLESTPAQTSVSDTTALLSSDSDRLGLCFSYPQGYTQLPNTDAVEITAPDIPGTDVKGLFWLEISDAYDRTAEEIADQDLTYAAGVDVGRWAMPLAGEQAVVLDGMPGQELQRRVYVVHQGMLYVLAFWPARSMNEAASDQIEALYAAVTSTWSWTPCSASPSDNGTAAVSAQVVVIQKLDYCFAYPRDFTLQINNDSQVEVIGPHSGLGGLVAGLVWIDAVDAQGRTAQEVADEEVKAFGGNPPRWTVMMGGEEALVLDGMPGQDPIRKVYIVHNGLLYTLNFTPYQSESETATSQAEELFTSVTSSWVWISSGRSCPEGS
jgi:hypothetical protein